MFLFFFFNDTATTEIYTLSLHDALPIFRPRAEPREVRLRGEGVRPGAVHGQEGGPPLRPVRSEEHTSELQSQSNLVCRLLLEKKKQHAHRCMIRCGALTHSTRTISLEVN